MDKTVNMDQMNVVFVGHVDHGKSTIIGRLLADTKSLPEGKLEQVKATCAENARPFEYAFLLDALKDEQSQGITIDTARCFFHTKKRRYIIIDAPGHIEFLKNMITGAARADAAFIVIDADEGIQENSKRHGYMVAMLGITQVSVLVNKMDLVNYDENIFQSIKSEYTNFLARLNLHPVSFIPVSAICGVNIASLSSKTPWFNNVSVIEQFDAFKKINSRINLPFRFPVQDIYKFTASGDNRRIVAGTIETGSIRVGEEVIFLPSEKRSRIKTIESFNTPVKDTAKAEESIGFTLATQIYAKRGELMLRVEDKSSQVGSRFRANLFWMGKSPMIKNKKYKLKIGASRVSLKLVDILNVIDASELTSEKNKQQIDRHDVAECILETHRPIAFDLIGNNKFTGRFVIVDDYEIAGAGIIFENIANNESILKDHVRDREFSWTKSAIPPKDRASVYGHGAKFIVVTGDAGEIEDKLATALEKRLFINNFKVYYLRATNIEKGLYSDLSNENDIQDEYIIRLGELARIITDSGLIFIISISDIDDYDLKTLELLNQPNEILVVNIGKDNLMDYDSSLNLDQNTDINNNVEKVCELLKQKKVILEYCI